MALGDLVRKILPEKVCLCIHLQPGLKILMFTIIALRFICAILGCFYGPYIYLVLPIGGLYLATDILLTYSIFKVDSKERVDEATASYRFPKSEDESFEDGDSGCDFPTQKIWIGVWMIMNVMAVMGLAVAIGLFLNLGTWSMSHNPIHVVMFVFVILLTAILLYTEMVVATLYIVLKDAWLLGILGDRENNAGLTHGGRRINP